MNIHEDAVADHYGGPDLLSAILDNARNPDGSIDAERVSMMDEFHIGGAGATARLLDRMALRPGARLLDIGSGVGGPARHAARRGAVVTGVDLTPRFVEAARALTAELGYRDEAVSFAQGSALDLPFEDASFDAAMVLHVGMNIADKRALMSEVARVLRPGGGFAVYDVMRADGSAPGDGLDWPLPWSATPETSFLASEAEYRAAAEAAGLEVVSAVARRAEAEAFFAVMKARADENRAAGLPPPVGLATIMGEETPRKIANMIQAVTHGRIAPVELHLRKPDVG